MFQKLIALVLSLVAVCLASDDTSMVGHLQPFGTQGPVSEIDAVDGFIAPAAFLTDYAMQNRPLLFRGAAKVFPAFAKWTDEYLQQVSPPRPAGDVHIEHNKKESRSQKYSYVHFKDFLRDYNTSDIYMVSSVPNFLLGDLVLPFPLQCKFFASGGLDSHVAWFSSGGTSSVIHSDSYENINCLLRGRKTLVMLNTTRYREAVDRIIDKVDGAFSTADSDRIDIVGRPEFSGLEFHSVEMHAGDCLYIPLLWVHQVRSFDNNLAVNVWWSPRERYNLAECGKRFNPDLTFSRVHFGRLLRETRKNADEIREILAYHLTLPATEQDLLSLLTGSDTKAVPAAWPQFPSTVSAFFWSLDVNRDRRLSESELKDKMKFKAATAMMEAVSAYNMQVFAMHTAPRLLTPGDTAGKLPKLFRTRQGDYEVFAEVRTWQMPPRAAPVEISSPPPSVERSIRDVKDEL